MCLSPASVQAQAGSSGGSSWGLELDDALRSLPTQAVLWFSDLFWRLLWNGGGAFWSRLTLLHYLVGVLNFTERSDLSLAMWPLWGCSFSSAYWSLPACSLNSTESSKSKLKFKARHVGIMFSIRGVNTKCWCPPLFPHHAELHSLIQCELVGGRTRTSRALTALRRQVCRQQYRLSYTSAVRLCGKAFFKSIHCTCNWYCSYCVQICRALWYKTYSNFNHEITFFHCTVHNPVCTSLSAYLSISNTLWELWFGHGALRLSSYVLPFLSSNIISQQADF